ncbi:MAG: PDDEXK nuclease domain-containing protein [Bacteroidales bacterium]|jgi:predicted nuclease of restriction endonuclease-like (RecB) superfamily|nr:PDDEXK nuclease domain-containing protein [Bacteroidales bacterium]
MATTEPNINLFHEVKSIIEQGKQKIALSINANLTSTYWHIGRLINQNILKEKRAEYGEQIIANLSKALTREYGKGWSSKHLRHCLRFAETFPDLQIVSALWRQLSWTHFKSLIYLNDNTERAFYLHMCINEKWSTRELNRKIDSMLFQRTAISKKPETLVRSELEKLDKNEQVSPDLVFRDHYVLDFLNLKDTYSERDLELAVLKEIENFILELGVGFAFMARQKRMLIDGNDFYLDLLFYNRKLKRLVAIDLKIGRFKAEYKGQMELYLRWLEKYESEAHEEKPIGLLMCAEGNQEQVELLQIEESNIRVAEYITQTLPKALLEQKLNQFTTKAKRLLEERNEQK